MNNIIPNKNLVFKDSPLVMNLINDFMQFGLLISDRTDIDINIGKQENTIKYNPHFHKGQEYLILAYLKKTVNIQKIDKFGNYYNIIEIEYDKLSAFPEHELETINSIIDLQNKNFPEILYKHKNIVDNNINYIFTFSIK